MYYRYIETNISGEGETWSRFIKIPENDFEEARFDALKKLARLSDNEESENSYYFDIDDDASLRIYTQSEVDFLLNENEFYENGYAESYKISEIKDEIVKLASGVDEEIPWYKAEELIYKLNKFK